MKKVVLLLICFFAFAGNVVAQEKTGEQKTKNQKTKPVLVPVYEEDHLVFDKGKVYEVQKQVWTEIKAPVTLKNGDVVKPNGSYETKDKQEHQLKKGEYVDMKGNHFANKSQYNQRKGMTSKKHKKSE
jgi:hypothetical protein